MPLSAHPNARTPNPFTSRPVVEEEDAGILQDPELIPPRYQPEWGQRWSTTRQGQREGPGEAL